MRSKITGRNAVLEGLKYGTRFLALYIDQGAKGDKVRDIINLATKKRVRITFVGRHKLDKLSQDEHHQGVIGLIAERERSFEEIVTLIQSKEKGVLVMVREIQYDQNLGAILRTAEAAGAGAVILPTRQKTGVNEVVRRVSMGASERIIVVEANLFEAIKQLKSLGCKVVGVEIDGKIPYYQVSVDGWVVYLFGGEDKGLSPQLEERCDQVAMIPMAGKVTSLNVSATVSVVLFDHLRRGLRSQSVDRRSRPQKGENVKRNI